MDAHNKGITAEDIDRIRDSPKSFKWAYWNNKENFGGLPLRIRNMSDPPEEIVGAEVLKYAPNLLVVIHQSVLKRPQIGCHEDGFTYEHGRERRLFKDYVMIMSLSNMGINSTDNGYAALRIHPKNSIFQEDIFVSVDMPDSKGRFSGSSRESKYETLDELIATPRVKDEQPILFKEGRNVVFSYQDEVKRLLSGEGKPLFGAQLPEGYHRSLLAGENLLTQFLIMFKGCLDELGISYRK